MRIITHQKFESFAEKILFLGKLVQSFNNGNDEAANQILNFSTEEYSLAKHWINNATQPMIFKSLMEDWTKEKMLIALQEIVV